MLTVSGQLRQLGGRLIAGPPESDAGRRVIGLDKMTVAAPILAGTHEIGCPQPITASGS